MDKSRKQFEEWFAPQKEEMKRNGLGMISITRMHQRQLSAWQASRESLEIELPKKCNTSIAGDTKTKYYFNGINEGIDKCKQILISNGVKIKNE
ncbi:hypothetical protein [Providencia sp. PROV033]|uniref:hypothetical protein n=1 Tax=Providencia sp. PROV033 TaxID=2949765 RepID=UPI002349B0A8|nr:hypothetical protein [Providencia sp. PROV033]